VSDNDAFVTEAAAAIDALTPLLRQLLPECDDGSATYKLYSRRLLHDRLLLPNETALAARLCKWHDAPHRVHVYCAAALSMLLALLGFDIVCLEIDERFHAINVALFAAIAKISRRTIHLRSDLADRSSDDAELTGVLALAPSLHGTWNGQRLSAMRSLSRYDFVIVNAETSDANTPLYRNDVVADLCGHGFVAAQIINIGIDNRYVLLKREVLFARLQPPFHPVGAHGWSTLLPAPLACEADGDSDPNRSRLWLLQDGLAVGPPHSQHNEITELGEGRYSHWGRWLNFSTSDNSDPNSNGRSYFAARRNELVASSNSTSVGVIDLLADILKAREVTEIAYFHTDHFEPWHAHHESRLWWKGLERYAQLTRNLRFGGRSSLFYSPLLVHRPYARRRLAFRRGQFRGVRAMGDGVAFHRPSAEFLSLCKDMLAPLETDLGHEFHIHIHHEGWTKSSCVHPELQDWINKNSTPKKDSRRFDFFVGLCRDVMAEEIGRKFDHWGFIHGNWSLNAADPKYCCITDEIKILKRHGCFGDFTFPAGESHFDPLLNAPFTCDTTEIARSYDRVESSPRAIAAGARDLARNRFLIWNSAIKSARASLDIFSPNRLPLFSQPEFLLRDWLAQSVIVGNCLFIKTHAHSVDPKYALFEEDSHIPHTFPSVRNVFDLLERVAERADVPIDAVTVNEVMARLIEFDGGRPGPRANERT
jgi:hypothetical protein